MSKTFSVVLKYKFRLNIRIFFIDKINNFISKITNYKNKIIFAPVDDAENNLEERTRKGVSAGVRELIGVFLILSLAIFLKASMHRHLG